MQIILEKRLVNAYDKKSKEPQLLNIASDGEAYGHHKAFGEMALAYLYDKVLVKKNIKPINYSYFLELFPPTWEVNLKTGPEALGTAWSCSHGVGRWYRNCGCKTGGRKRWNQKWRTPLREGFNTLKEDLDHIFIEEGSKYFKDPWEARNNYINVLCDPSEKSKYAFTRKYCKSIITENEKSIWQLLEMQKNSMLMFTSCGWFLLMFQA